MATKFFEDIRVGDSEATGGYDVTEAEMVEFSRKWDPLPIHVDPDSEQAAVHGGIIASGQYTLAVKQKLLTQTTFLGPAVIGAIGWEGLRFVSPVRAGHALFLTVECIDKRASRSRADRGIVKFRMTMATRGGEVVLVYTDLVMVRKGDSPFSPQLEIES